MLQISCPNNNIAERLYSINVLLSTFIGLDENEYDVIFDNLATCYTIKIGEKTIVVEDHFFRYHQEPLSYLSPDFLPGEFHMFNGFGLSIPIIYGCDKCVSDGSCTTIGLDVFASTFYMLTRWEEALLGREDNGDCNENELYAVKNGFYMRAVVHEYEQLLRKLLFDEVNTDSRTFKLVLSHDVDGFLTPSWLKVLRDFMKQSVFGPPKNKILTLTWMQEIYYKRFFPTAYHQFDLYRKLSEKYEINEWFYFKVCDKGETEATYTFNDVKTIDVVRRLKACGDKKMQIGFHPSQSTFSNNLQWYKEVERITGLLGYVPNIGRNHHLLYNFETYRNWESLADDCDGEDLNISNCVFHKKIGFRSGAAVPYPFFDIYERKTLKVLEHPCQIMDTIIRYESAHKSEELIWHDIIDVIRQVQQYRGELVLTWHIYIRNKDLILKYFNWCERILKWIYYGES